MFKEIFKNQNVLITGHTGFKGSWLALWLHESGANVTGFALPPNTRPNHFELIGLADLVCHTEGDIRDIQVVKRAFDKAQPSFVFHLAAQPIVSESYNDPKTTFDTNIGGTVNILEAIRQCPSVKAAVIITSDKCYENREWAWGYRENDMMGGHDPYSASKGATEIVASAYLRSYFMQNGQGPHPGFATARSGNVIGGGDWAKDRIIPDCIRALTVSQPIVIRNPKATRPWQHVLDPLCGYLQLAAKLLEDPEMFSGAWNFGPQTKNQVTVDALVKRFICKWGKGRIETPNTEKGPHEAHFLHLNIDKSVFFLKWQPVLDSSSAIDWTVDWYQAWYRSESAIRELSIRQIKAFTDLAVKNRLLAS